MNYANNEYKCESRFASLNQASKLEYILADSLWDTEQSTSCTA
jgi:hypothetical protein